MKKTDKIIDEFARRLDSQGIPIEPSLNINWIDEIIRRLPAKYPPSFMSFISRYVFDGFELGKLNFFANRGSGKNSELSDAIFEDKIIFEVTSSNGFLFFARPEGGSYDPICFDIRNRKKREYPVVKLDHESILVSEKISIVENVYPSLLEFVNEYNSR